MDTKQQILPRRRRAEVVKSSLGSTLRQAREATGLSLRGLARKIGISPAQISQIEGGTRKSPGFQSIAKIAAALSLSLDEVAAAAGLGAEPSAGTPRPTAAFPLDEVKRIKAEAASVSARADALLSILENADLSNNSHR